MSGDASASWSAVKAEDLATIKGDEFEGFCESLVRCEAYHRHTNPELDGGAGQYKQDGGRDILLTVAEPPIVTRTAYQRTYLLEPLTEDPIEASKPTRTVYSCKTGKTWLNKALDNAKKGTQRAFEVLEEGGYFKLLINECENLDAEVKRDEQKRTPHEHLRQAYWERLKRSNPNAPDPGPRIRILDAKRLAAYLRARQPESAEMDRWAEMLQVMPLLWSLAKWRKSHEEDRQEPTWVGDDERSHIRSELLRQLASTPSRAEDRIACLVGKPGVGKTRLVIEALASDPAVEQRVRVARSAEEADRAIDTRRLLRQCPDVVLIVDDCLVSEARSIAQSFRTTVREGSRAHLVLLVPASFDAVRADLPRDHIWSLAPLAPELAREIVANTTGRANNDPEVVAIARLSEGFPWFARLLALEFAETDEHAPLDMREATRWALASARETNSPTELDELRLRRARSLLAVSLTHSVDWDQLDDEQRAHLASAVGLPGWQIVMDAALECHRRGILRRRLGWQFKYVTPQVLEREIIAWLLDPDDGPDPGGRTLARFGEAYLEAFTETLTRLELPARTVAGVVDIALEDLRATEFAGLGAAGLLGARLRFLAHHRPDQTARELTRMIDATDLDHLRAAIDERRGLVWALESVSTRRGSFADAEAGLFRLACAENETYANNATLTWACLFSPAPNIAHRGFADRLCVLAGRLSDADPWARRIALAGIEVALSTFATPPIPKGSREGPWPQPTRTELHDGRLQAWTLLAGRCVDPVPAVATAARRMSIELLSDAVSVGLGAKVMDILVTQVATWSLDERVLLREALYMISEHDGELLASTLDEFTRLEAAVEPRSFREQLRQRVGVWRAELSEADEDQLDDELARAGLQTDELRAELGWLATEQAARGHMFVYAIGRCDLDGSLFDALRSVAIDNPQSWQAQALLGRYIGGMASDGRRAQAESLARTIAANPDEATPTALAIVELGATPERLRWLEASLGAGLINVSAIEELGRRNHWMDCADDDDVLHLVSVMADGDRSTQAAALGLLVHRYQHAALQTDASDLLERLFASLVASHDPLANRYWWRAAKMLIDCGRAARVAELAVAALSTSSSSNEFAWRALHAAAEHDPSGAFAAVANALDESGPGGKLLVSFWFHRKPFEWPAAEILEWVGNDERRGRIAAGLVRTQDERLPDIIQTLIRRFGPHGSVAREIQSRLMSTDGLVPSLAEHDRMKLAQARVWVAHPDESIAAFAETLVDALERSYERHAAQEDDNRRRYGT